MLEAAKGKDSEAFKELDAIEGIGEVVAEAIADFFAEPHNVRVVDELLKEVAPQPLEARRSDLRRRRQDGRVHRHARRC